MAGLHPAETAGGRCLRAAIWALAASTAALAAQEPAPPLFRSRIDAIEVELRVVDARNQPVVDLDPGDIEVLEDGRRQQVLAFSRVTVPIASRAGGLAPAGPAGFAAPDVASNRVTAGRIFVLILDDLHVDRRNTHVVKQAARRFVEEHVEPRDLTAVIYSGVRPDAAQDFTSDRRLLLEAIDKFVGRKLPPATNERIEQYNLLFRGRGRPQFEDLRDRHDGERAFNARSAMASIESIASVLARVTGRRKAALYFSEGLDYDLSGLRSRGRVPGPAASGPTVLAPTVPTGGAEADAVGRLDVHSYAHDVLLSLQAAMGAAARANVAVYSMGVRSGDNSDAVADLGAPVNDPSLGLSVQDVNQEMRDAEENLVLLAASTGGFAALRPTTWDAVFERIVRESSDYYLLAYSPWNPAPDGRYREIAVNVKRPGVRVFARKGYYAPRAAPKRVSRFVAAGVSSDTSTMVMAPIPSSGLTLDVHAFAVKRDRKRADLIVTTRIDGRELAGDPGADGVSNALELASMAIDSTGKVQDATGRAIDVRLDAGVGGLLRESGYRVVGRLNVPPGRYQVRQAVRERNGGRLGSVFIDVEVPDFTNGLTMSGLLLTSGRAAVTPTSVDPDTFQRLALLPSVQRTFSADDELTAVAEVYDTQERDVEIVATVVDAAGQVKLHRATTVPRRDFKATGGVHRHEVKLPLANVSGELTLSVEARPGGTPRAGVTRRVSFTVAPQ